MRQSSSRGAVKTWLPPADTTLVSNITAASRPPRSNSYFIEPLPGRRGQLHVDLVVDGRCEASWPVGSPAPLATIEALYPEALA